MYECVERGGGEERIDKTLTPACLTENLVASTQFRQGVVSPSVPALCGASESVGFIVSKLELLGALLKRLCFGNQ